MDLDGRIKAYKFVAYSAVTFSVVAVLSVCVTLPMVYNYVHHVKRTMHQEINFCKGSAKDIWSEVNHLKSIPIANNRTARQAGYDAGVSGGTVTSGGQCDGCCLPGPPGPRELQESLDDLENPERRVCLATPEDRRRNLASLSHPRHASLALKDHLDLLVLLVLRETQEPLDSLDDLEPTPLLASPDPRDRPDLPENPEPPVLLEILGCPPRVNHSSPENLVLPENRDHQAHLVLPDSLVPTALPDPQARKDPTDPTELPETTDNPVNPDRQDPPERKERRESARSTAPSTEECSSKMEPDVKAEHVREVLVYNVLNAFNLSLLFASQSHGTHANKYCLGFCSFDVMSRPSVVCWKNSLLSQHFPSERPSFDRFSAFPSAKFDCRLETLKVQERLKEKTF